MRKSLGFYLLSLFIIAISGHVKSDVQNTADPSKEMAETTDTETEIPWTSGTETTVVPMTSTGAPSNPSCPVKLTSQKLNVSMMIGAWFTVESYPRSTKIERSCDLLNVTYESPNSFRIESIQYVTTSSESSYSSNEPLNQVFSSFQLTQNRNSSLQDIQAHCLSNKNEQITNWRILKTNYWEYAIQYACIFKDGQFVDQHVNIVCRSPNPAKKIIRKARKALRLFGLSTKPLEKILQDPGVCKQYPIYRNMLKVNKEIFGDWKDPHYKKHHKKHHRYLGY